LGLYERLDDVKPLLGLACLGHAAFGALLTPMGNDLRDDNQDRAGPITATLCAWDKASEVRLLSPTQSTHLPSPPD
jgi:hypothetical protein